MSSSAFDDLAARLRGALLLPGDPACDDARSVWNAMIDRPPAAIARSLPPPARSLTGHSTNTRSE